MKKNKNNCHNYKACTTKIPTTKKKDKDKGNLDIDIITLLCSTLLFIDKLFLRINVFFIKKDTILERTKET